MRIVVDTNTVVSGLLWQGPPRRLIDLARESAFVLCTSLELLAELKDVIHRPKFAQRLQDVGHSAAEAVQRYRSLAVLVDAPPLLHPVSRDPDDDIVLATAVAAEAALIASGDRDLLDLGAFRGIRILNAADALRAIHN